MNDRTIVYIFLSGFALYQLNEGISAYIKDATIFDETEIKIVDLSEPVEWPDLQICTNPFVKNQDKYQEIMSKSFQDENEFNTLAEAAFFAKVNEMITAFSIGLPEQYLAILNGSNHLPLEKPYIKPTIIDFDYYGYCATISYSALKEYIIASNDGLTGDEKDLSFFSVIWLKVSWQTF